jgi:hypothetical protein
MMCFNPSECTLGAEVQLNGVFNVPFHLIDERGTADEVFVEGRQESDI